MQEIKIVIVNSLEHLKVANKKRRCSQCKTYKIATDGIVIRNIFYCDFDCATAKAFNGISKGADIVHKAKKKVYNENKLSTRKRATKEACHEYIRLRDKDKLCICCGEPLGDDFEAGHFWESGNFSFIRYHEDNIHGQRKHCNRFKGGDSGFYRENLVNKIGPERVQWLDNNRSNKTKMTADDYREIEAYYKAKINKLNQY
jgi:hypothetical protein